MNIFAMTWEKACRKARHKPSEKRGDTYSLPVCHLPPIQYVFRASLDPSAGVRFEPFDQVVSRPAGAEPARPGARVAVAGAGQTGGERVHRIGRRRRRFMRVSKEQGGMGDLLAVDQPGGDGQGAFDELIHLLVVVARHIDDPANARKPQGSCA
jgi:hypothetical protein